MPLQQPKDQSLASSEVPSVGMEEMGISFNIFLSSATGPYGCFQQLSAEAKTHF